MREVDRPAGAGHCAEGAFKFPRPGVADGRSVARFTPLAMAGTFLSESAKAFALGESNGSAACAERVAFNVTTAAAATRRFFSVFILCSFCLWRWLPPVVVRSIFITPKPGKSLRPFPRPRPLHFASANGEKSVGPGGSSLPKDRRGKIKEADTASPLDRRSQ